MTKTIYLAGGCFWGMQKYLKLIYGIIETEVGFANGNTDNPTYKEVYTDKTGYAETVKVVYNPEVLQLEDLIEFYFKAIDPLSINRQGEDFGTRYRTGVYYTDEADSRTIGTMTEYTPVSVATQVVAGLNYKFLCRYDDRNGNTGDCFVVIYKPLQGDPELTGIEKL